MAEIGNGQGPILGFDGHMDTVAIGDSTQWTYSPFSAHITSDGKMIGRGTSDMKAGLAAIVSAMIEIKRENININGTVRLSQIAQVATHLQTATVASERVLNFLNEEEITIENESMVHLKAAKGNIAFDHVKLGYDEDKLITKDFSAKVKEGEKLLLLGQQGQGKQPL